jgi:hypothetical protein
LFDPTLLGDIHRAASRTTSQTQGSFPHAVPHALTQKTFRLVNPPNNPLKMAMIVPNAPKLSQRWQSVCPSLHSAFAPQQVFPSLQLQHEGSIFLPQQVSVTRSACVLVSGHPQGLKRQYHDDLDIFEPVHKKQREPEPSPALLAQR